MNLLRASLFLSILVVAAALGLSGCATPLKLKNITKNVVITNVTPAVFPENPSGLYTFLVRVTPNNSAMRKSSLKVTLTIDGQTFEMRPSPLGRYLYEHDHRIEVGRSEAKFFVTATYQIERIAGQFDREDWTQIYTVKIANRYALSLDAIRGPVGATVTLLGRGFSRGDTIFLGETAAPTTFVSANALTFTVPAVATGTYRVKLSSAGGEIDVGSFRVDSASLSVSPTSLILSRGQKVSLTFAIPTAAGPGGFPIAVTTDVPKSVVMPEVVVPAGQKVVSIPVIGGEPGSGSLFVEVPGFDPVVIPVSVN